MTQPRHSPLDKSDSRYTPTLDTLLYRDVFNASPIGIAIENLDGQPLFVNPAFCSMLGFSAEEVYSKHCVDFSPPEDAEKDLALFQQLRAGSIDRYQLEKRYVRRDGSLVWGNLSVSLLRSCPSSLVLAIVEDITAKKTAEEALSRMNRKLIESQEQERTRIGRELHDDINQRLAMLAIELERLQINPSDVRSRLQQLQEETIAISSDVQALSHELHTSKLEYLGVVPGMRNWCREFGERQKMEVDFRSDVPSPLPIEIGLSLFRILQEALHNAAKHSGAKRVEVQVGEHSNEVHLLVRDSGSGFDIEAARRGNGLGLTSMRERLKLVSGELSIASEPQEGTSIHARVPLSPKVKSRLAAGHT